VGGGGGGGGDGRWERLREVGGWEGREGIGWMIWDEGPGFFGLRGSWPCLVLGLGWARFAVCCDASSTTEGYGGGKVITDCS
jgi:hypothetical protein